MGKFTMPAAVHLLFERDGEVLLLKRANTGYQDGNYTLVAGHHDGNESLIQAAIREAREEAGVDIRPQDLIFKLVMHKKETDERIGFFFLVTHWSGEIRNAELDKCDDLSWFPADKLPPNMVPYVREALQAYQDGRTYVEFGF